MPEAVLLDVVAHAHPQRLVDLGLGLQQRGDLPADALDRRVLGPLEAPGVADLREHLLGRRAQPRVAQARGHRRLRVDGRDRERLLELRRAGEHAALVVDQQRVAVEHELVLPADEVRERDRGEVVAGALDEHLLALEPLAPVIWRAGRVQQQRRARLGLVGRRRARHPHVLADRQPDARVAELDHRRPGTGLEVALLVGHAVVPEPHLAVVRAHRAVGDDRDRVEHVLGALGVADDRDDPLHGLRDPRQRLLRRAQEVLLEQQVLRRVAGQHQLREHDQLGALVASALDVLGDLGGVALEVAHARVELGEREAQRGETLGHADQATPGRARRPRSRAAARDRSCAARAARRARSRP